MARRSAKVVRDSIDLGLAASAPPGHLASRARLFTKNTVAFRAVAAPIVFDRNTETARSNEFLHTTRRDRGHADGTRNAANLGIWFTLVACSDPNSGTGPDTSSNEGGTTSSASNVGGIAGSISSTNSEGGIAGTTSVTNSQGATAGVVGSAGSLGCEVERARLEQAMTVTLDAAAVNENISQLSDFTRVLETSKGHRFSYSHGASSVDTV